MKNIGMRLTLSLLILLLLTLTCHVVADDEEIEQTLYLEQKCIVHHNTKIVKYSIYSSPHGTEKTQFLALELNNIFIDVEKGLVFEATDFSLEKAKKSCKIKYKALKPIEGSSASIKTFRNKWNLEAHWKENELLVTIPFQPGQKITKPKAEKQQKPVAPPADKQEKPEKKDKPSGEINSESPLKMSSLGNDILWNQGNNKKKLAPPSIQVVKVPTLETKGLKTLGISYQIVLDSQPLDSPVHLSFPVPPEAKNQLESLVFLKISKGKEEIVFPSSTDKKSGRVTLLCHSFSVYTPALWDIDYALAFIDGELTLTPGCEESPDKVYFDMTCLGTRGGHKANFVNQADGVGPFQFFMPLPPEYYGTYTFHSLIGASDNFIYSMNPLYKTLNVDGMSKKYHIVLNMIPTTTQLKGKVIDKNENPVSGIKIELKGGDDLSYKTKSRSDGSYYIEFVGLSDPHNQPSETFTYKLTDPNEDNLSCATVEGSLTLTAGKTYTGDLLYQNFGLVVGVVKDKTGNFLEGLEVSVTTSDSEIFSAKTNRDGYYKVEDVPVGDVTVSVECPNGSDKQSQEVKVKCSKGEDKIDFTNFVLECSEGMLFSISHSGAMESEGTMIINKANTNSEFSIFLPKGEEEASVNVTYTIEHHLKGKKGQRLSFEFSSSTFNLDAVVRWTVTKNVKRGGVVEYAFQRETIDLQQKKMKVGLFENGDNFDTIDIAYDALIDPTLISPGTLYILEKDLPFKKDYQRSDTMPVAPAGLPGAQSLTGAKSQYRTSLIIECSKR